MSEVTEWKTPGTCANVDRDGKVAWVNPDNAKASDNDRAICDVAKTTYGDWLRCTNFGFTTGDIPSGSTIDGIEVKIEHQTEAPSEITDSALYLRKTSGQIGDDKPSAEDWATSDEEITYGGATDTWNAGLVDTDIVSSDFGVDLSAYNRGISESREARVDCVWVRIHYTAEAPPEGVPQQAMHLMRMRRR